MTLHPRRRLPFVAALLTLAVLGFTIRFQLPKLDSAIHAEQSARHDLQTRQTAQSLAAYQPLIDRLATPLPVQATVVAALRQASRQLKLADASYTFLPVRVANGIAALPVTIVLPNAVPTAAFDLIILLKEALQNEVQLTGLTFERRSDSSRGQARLELVILGLP